MPKALLGQVLQPDPGLVAELRRLRRRVRDLEAELARLKEENVAPAAEAGPEAPVS